MSFNSILNYYRTDKLHCLDELCVLDFASDLEFWMISDINLEICCVEKFFARKDTVLEVIEKGKKLQPEVEDIEDFGSGYFAEYQKYLWDLFEKPQSSLAAKVVSIVSVRYCKSQKLYALNRNINHPLQFGVDLNLWYVLQHLPLDADQGHQR